ncbi:MAG: hypothetical protein SFW67_13220 [Myxococcaceae bacterium]|nr:hypothetical protein [Myxococcaceae bacterium]
MLGLVLVGLLAAPDVSSSVSMGLSAGTQVPGGNTVLNPTVAAQLNLTQRFPVGEARLRLAPVLVPSFAVGVVGVSLQDLGTRLELEFPVSDEVSVGVRLDPFNSLLRRVSFDWANLVGRPALDTTGFNPVLAADVRGQRWSVFLAARLSVRTDAFSGLSVLRADALAGGSLRVGSTTVEARVARFDFGLAPGLANAGFRVPTFSYLGTGRVTWNWHGEVGMPIDLVTYREDPLRFERFFDRVAAVSEGPALTVSLEGGAGSQVLQNPDVFPMTRPQALGYGDLQLRAQVGMTRFFGIGRISSLSFIVHDAGGFPPFFAPGAVTPTWSGFLGADHSFLGGRLTPGVLVRLLQPATRRQKVFFDSTEAVIQPAERVEYIDPQGFATVVLTGEPGGVGPPGPTPRLLGMVTLRYVPFDALSLVGEFSVERDPNGSSQTSTIRGQLLAQLRL